MLPPNVKEDDKKKRASPWVLMNQFVTQISSIIHCEMIFIVENRRTKKLTRIISSIHRQHYLRLTTKDYDKKKLKLWKFYHYNCSDEEKAKIFRYERDSNKRPFNKIGFMWNFIMPFDFLRIDKKAEEVFCSEQITHNLKNTLPEKYGNLTPYAIHPAALFQIITTCEESGMFRECYLPTTENGRQPRFKHLDV